MTKSSKKRSKRLINWVINNPELARKEYPEITEYIIDKVRNLPPHEFANTIQLIPTLFRNKRKEIRKCLPIEKKLLIAQQIEMLTAITDSEYDEKIIQEAQKSVYEVALEQKTYWEAELDKLNLKVKGNPFPVIFTDEAYRLFCFLEKRFSSMDQTIPTKYSCIFHFMKYESLIKCSQKEYISFLLNERNVQISKIIRITFKYTDDIKPMLTRLYAEFNRKNTQRTK